MNQLLQKAEFFIPLYEQLEKYSSVDEVANELYEGCIKKIIKYASIRTNWKLYSFEQRRDEDPGRTITHDSLIGSFRMLYRYQKEKLNHPVTWLEDLGDDRKVIGDFACFIVFYLGVEMR